MSFQYFYLKSTVWNKIVTDIYSNKYTEITMFVQLMYRNIGSKIWNLLIIPQRSIEKQNAPSFSSQSGGRQTCSPWEWEWRRKQSLADGQSQDSAFLQGGQLQTGLDNGIPVTVLRWLPWECREAHFFFPQKRMTGCIFTLLHSVSLLESFCTLVSIFVYFPFFLLSILYHPCCAFPYCAMLCAVLSWPSFLLFQQFHSSKARICSYTSLTFWYI